MCWTFTSKNIKLHSFSKIISVNKNIQLIEENKIYYILFSFIFLYFDSEEDLNNETSVDIKIIELAMKPCKHTLIVLIKKLTNRFFNPRVHPRFHSRFHSRFKSIQKKVLIIKFNKDYSFQK